MSKEINEAAARQPPFWYDEYLPYIQNIHCVELQTYVNRHCTVHSGVFANSQSELCSLCSNSARPYPLFHLQSLIYSATKLHIAYALDI